MMNTLSTTKDMVKRQPVLSGFLVLIAIGVLARIVTLGTDSIWSDEAYSVWAATRSWTYLWTHVPEFETHPVFFYSIMKIWIGVFGESEVAVRSMSLLFNLLTVPVLMLIVRRLGDPSAATERGVIAAAVFLLSFTQVNSAQDARPYALMTLSMAVMMWGIIEIMMASERAKQPMLTIIRDDRHMLLAYAAFSIGAAVMAWIHNVGPLFPVIAGLVLLAWWGMTHRHVMLLANIVIASAFAVLLYTPNIINILGQLNTMDSQGFWLTRPSFADFVEAISKLPVGGSMNNAPFNFLVPIGAVISVGLVLIGALSLLRDQYSRHSRDGMFVVALLLALAFLPAFITFVVSIFSTPIFMFRTFQASQLSCIVLIAFAPYLFARWKPYVLAAIVVSSSISALSLIGYGAKENWRDIVLAVGADDTAQTPKMVVVAPSSEMPLDYYKRRLGVHFETLPVPGPFPVRTPESVYPNGGGGDPLITPDALPPVKAWVADTDEIWMVVRYEQALDQEGLIRDYLVQEFPCLLKTVSYAEKRARAC